MTLHVRPCLALALALSPLGCDHESTDDPRFRTTSPSSAQDATVRLGAGLDPVRVVSYSLGGDLADTLSAEGFDGLLAGADGIGDDAELVLRVEGVAPLNPTGIDDTLVQLRREHEVLDYPYKQFKFRVEVGGGDAPTTEIVASAAEQDAEPDFTVWHDSAALAMPGPAEPVEAIVYTLVAVDGTRTTCRAEVAPAEQLTLGFTPIEGSATGSTTGSTGHLVHNVADPCIAVLHAAAESRPSEAFFVRCDRSTTTASVGLRHLGGLTLKRGVISAQGDLVVEVASL